METLIIDRTETQVLVDLPKLNKIKVIVLKVKNNAFKDVEKPYEISILGKTMLDWVRLAVDNYAVQMVDYENGADVIETIRPFLSDEDFTVVLFSDTPLIKKRTVDEIVDYATTKDVNVCKLTRGYVFKTKFLKLAEKVYTAEPHYFDEEDFITAFGYKQLSLIEDIMRNRILNFHLKNGVRILDLSSVSIDADVTIKSGTEIHANNRIYGACIIGQNVKLLPNNVITSSIIEDNCEILYSVVKNSKIPQNSKIGPFKNIQ